MRLYSCKVRLGASLYNEVPKSDVTAAEIHILRTLHGSDAVVSIFETGKNKIGQSEERDRLEQIYAPGIVAAQITKDPNAAISAVFGIGAKLPDDIPGVEKAPTAKAKPVAEPEPEPTADPEE